MVKNKNYYRTQFAVSYDNARALAMEVVKKYGKKPWSGAKNGNKIIRVNVSNNWNGSIIGFEIINRKLYANVYWQGDHTDGKDCFLLSEATNGYRIPAKKEDSPWGTRWQHTEVRFDRETIHKALKAMLEE